MDKGQGTGYGRCHLDTRQHGQPWVFTEGSAGHGVLEAAILTVTAAGHGQGTATWTHGNSDSRGFVNATALPCTLHATARWVALFSLKLCRPWCPGDAAALPCTLPAMALWASLFSLQLCRPWCPGACYPHCDSCRPWTGDGHLDTATLTAMGVWMRLHSPALCTPWRCGRHCSH